MEVPEASVHSFVVRIWLEEKASTLRPALWRGHVTHVPSGTRRHIQRLSDLNSFITTYLDEMGAGQQENEQGSGERT